MRRSVAWLMLLLLLCPVVTQAQPNLPALTTDGFLQQGVAPYVYASREEGQWVYVDQTLRVEIARKCEGKPEVEWFESNIRCKADTALHTLFTDKVEPTSKYCVADELARRANAVFAINDDYFGGRREKNKATGIISATARYLASRRFAVKPRAGRRWRCSPAFQTAV